MEADKLRKEAKHNKEELEVRTYVCMQMKFFQHACFGTVVVACVRCMQTYSWKMNAFIMWCGFVFVNSGIVTSVFKELAGGMICSSEKFLGG